MEKLKRSAFIILVTVLTFVVFLSFMYKANNSAARFLGVTTNVLPPAAELIEARNNMSRILNRKQHELAKLECEKAEREQKTKELTSDTGGWCIHDAKELGSGGFHATDHKLAGVLAHFFKGKRVASFGDGPGQYKKLLDESGLLVVYDAYDGAPYSDIVSEGRVQFLDLSIPQYGLPLYDYVISLEVAEHIPKEYEHIYLDNLFRHAKEGIVISWAWPGQKGHSHVNEKPFEYVKKLMEDKGFEYDLKSSELLQEGCTFYWLKQSTSVFKRKTINEDLLKYNT